MNTTTPIPEHLAHNMSITEVFCMEINGKYYETRKGSNLIIEYTSKADFPSCVLSYDSLINDPNEFYIAIHYAKPHVIEVHP